MWVRHDTRARRSKFTPPRSREGPEDASSLSIVRMTMGTYTDGSPFIMTDDWTDRKSAYEDLNGERTGFTIFRRQDAQSRFSQDHDR